MERIIFTAYWTGSSAIDLQILDVEPEYRCNLKCVTCIHGVDKKKNPYAIDDTMPVQLFEKICFEGWLCTDNLEYA